MTPLFVQGGWVASREDWPQIAKVKDVHPDRDDKSGYCLDLVFYAPDGEKLGRISEPLDGPTGYDPFCSGTGFTPIEAPKFPIKKGRSPSRVDPSAIAYVETPGRDPALLAND